MHLALIQSIQSKLIPSLSMMADELNTKSNEFKDVIKTGRTHLQDATPITLGQEFHGYYGQITKGIEKLIDSNKWLSEVALGGTAVGTGINTHEEFAKLVCEEISSELGLEIKETDNHFQAQSTIDAVTATAGIIKSISLSIMKICNDIRWMGSGPRGGFGEIILPSVAPGSSIMPGKVNPTQSEAVTMVCVKVIGNHNGITMA